MDVIKWQSDSALLLEAADAVQEGTPDDMFRFALIEKLRGRARVIECEMKELISCDPQFVTCPECEYPLNSRVTDEVENIPGLIRCAHCSCEFLDPDHDALTGTKEEAS